MEDSSRQAAAPEAKDIARSFLHVVPPNGSGRLYKNRLWRVSGKNTSRLNISIHLVLVIMVVLVFPAVAE